MMLHKIAAACVDYLEHKSKRKTSGAVEKHECRMNFETCRLALVMLSQRLSPHEASPHEKVILFCERVNAAAFCMQGPGGGLKLHANRKLLDIGRQDASVEFQAK